MAGSGSAVGEKSARCSGGPRAENLARPLLPILALWVTLARLRLRADIGLPVFLWVIPVASVVSAPSPFGQQKITRRLVFSPLKKLECMAVVEVECDPKNVPAGSARRMLAKMEGILMKRLSRSEWLIVQPALLDLDRFLGGSVEVAAEVDKRFFLSGTPESSKNDVCEKSPEDMPTLVASTPLYPPDPTVWPAFHHAIRALRKCKRNTEADYILSLYDHSLENAEKTQAYIRLLLADLNPDKLVASRTMTSGDEEATAKTPGGHVPPAGVSLRTAATRIRQGDRKGQEELMKRWRNSKAPRLPDAIGKNPRHSQQNLYEPAALLSFLKKVEGDNVDRDWDLTTYFRDVCKPPRKQQVALTHPQEPTEPTAKTG